MQGLPIYPEVPRLAIEDAAIKELNPGCRDCRLGLDSVRNVCMPAEAVGEGDSLLVVTGAPSQNDDRHGRPQMGAIGAYLRKQIIPAWPGTVVFDHALRCPTGKKKPSPKLYTTCRGYLAGTVAEARPTRILAIGAEACLSVIGRGFPTMSVRRGYAHTSDGVPVMILMPPGLGMRNRFVRGWFEDDLKWALTATPPMAPRAAVVFKVTTVDDAEEAMFEARMAGGFNFDLETFGHPHNWEHTVLTAGITPKGSDVAYVWDEEFLEDPAVRAPLDAGLADPGLGVQGQNVKFDCVHWQVKYGVTVRGVDHDDKLVRRIMQADADAKLVNMQAFVGMAGGKDEVKPHITAGVKELKRMSKKRDIVTELFKDRDPDKLDIALDRIALGDKPKVYAYAAIPKDLRTRYCATDAISQDKIREWQEARLENWGRDVWQTTTQGLNYAMTQMEVNGIAVSRANVDALRAQTDLEIAEHQAVLDQYAPDLNVNSGAQVGTFLFEKLRLRSTKRTKGGGYSTTAEILEKLKHPAPLAIVGLKRAGKFKTQYADNMAFFIRDDGRIHPTVNIDGTETGRMSCKNPNLFNIPRADTASGKLARDMFVSERGKVIIEADYSQIELRVSAFLSGDQVMIDMFKLGVDFHLETAKLIASIFGLDPDDIDADHPLRSRAKTVIFAAIYGDTVDGLAAKLGIPRKLAAQLNAAILGKFVRLKAWIAESLAFGRRHGYTKTWWDGREYRRRPLWQIADPDDASRETAERSTWNTKAQGTAAEFTNNSMARFQQVIEAKRLPVKQVLTVYDSIMLEVEESAAAVDDAIGLLGEVMTGWNSLGVPLVADFKKGHQWGSLDKVAA